MPKLPKSKIHITLDELNGAQIWAKSVSLGDALDLDELPIAEQLASLADALTSWDLLDDDDQPIPCDLAGLRSLEFGHAKTILTGWIKAITAVAAPLEKPSPNGGTSEPAPFVPTEVL